VSGPRTGHIKWQRTFEGAVTPGAVVGRDGTIYASSNGGVLHALDPATGADKWTYDSHSTGGGDLSVSPLILPGGTVVWPTPGPRLLALSPAGALLWSLDLPGKPTSPASADGKRIYVGDTSGSVTAVDIASGGRHLAWSIRAGTISYGSVVTSGNGRLYTTADSSLVAIDDHGPNAAVAWRQDPGDDITEVSAGLAPDGTALLGTNGVKEWAYHSDGSPSWNSPRIITYSSPAVTASGLAYLGDHHGNVHAFDTRTGATVANYHVGAEIWSAPIIDKDYNLYIAGQDGHVHGLARQATVLFDVNLGSPIDSYPALTADGTLIVGARDSRLTAIN